MKFPEILLSLFLYHKHSNYHYGFNLRMEFILFLNDSLSSLLLSYLFIFRKTQKTIFGWSDEIKEIIWNRKYKG